MLVLNSPAPTATRADLDPNIKQGFRLRREPFWSLKYINSRKWLGETCGILYANSCTNSFLPSMASGINHLHYSTVEMRIVKGFCRICITLLSHFLHISKARICTAFLTQIHTYQLFSHFRKHKSVSLQCVVNVKCMLKSRYLIFNLYKKDDIFVV